MKTRQLWFLFVLAFLLFVLCLSSSGKLGAGPLSIQLEIPAGETGVATVHVSNGGEKPLHLAISLRDWNRSPDGRLNMYSPGTLERSCADWIEFLSPTDLLLQPGERDDVLFAMAVPEGADGAHWAILLVDQVSPEEPAEETPGFTTKVQVVENYAVKILQSDPATEHMEGLIPSLEIMELDPLRLEAVFQNTGNAHLQAEGYAEIRDVQGETVREMEIERFPSLPGEARSLELRTAELPSGKYLALVVIDFGGDYLVARERPFQVP